MKNISINTGASWDTTIPAPQNGDTARETFWDTLFTALADRLGALKALVDGKASLSAASNTWTGNQTINPSNPLQALKVYGELLFPLASESAADARDAGLLFREQIMNDANETWDARADIFIVPTITAHRTYKFNGIGAGNYQRVLTVVRPRTADAFSVTLQDTGSNTIAVIPASVQGSVTMFSKFGMVPDMRPIFWTNGVTNVSTTV